MTTPANPLDGYGLVTVPASRIAPPLAVVLDPEFLAAWAQASRDEKANPDSDRYAGTNGKTVPS